MKFTLIEDFGVMKVRIQGVGISYYIISTIGGFISLMNI